MFGNAKRIADLEFRLANMKASLEGLAELVERLMKPRNQTRDEQKKNMQALQETLATLIPVPMPIEIEKYVSSVKGADVKGDRKLIGFLWHRFLKGGDLDGWMTEDVVKLLERSGYISCEHDDIGRVYFYTLKPLPSREELISLIKGEK